MGQSSRQSFERLYRQVTPGTRHAFIKKFVCLSIPPLEHLMLSAGDPQTASIAPVGTPWRVGDKGGEPYSFNMASTTNSIMGSKKEKMNFLLKKWLMMSSGTDLLF